jgi:hypothetical protein
MKVIIGKYKNWVGPYQIAEFLLEPLTWFKPKRKNKLQQALNEHQEPHDALCHKFGEWLATRKDGSDTYLTKICLWIESKKKRKVKIQIDPWDTWSMDATLSMLILPMLKQLNVTKHGAPHVEDKDVPKELRSTSAPSKENEWDIDENHFKRWEWVMSEMIWAFEQLNDDNNDAQFHSGESEILWQALDKDYNPIGKPEDIKSKTKHEGVVTYQMVKGPNDTSVYDAKGHKKHAARIANGLRLFGTYYRGLWD